MLKSKLNSCKNNSPLLISSLVLLLFMVFPLSACEKANNYNLPDVNVGETFEITLKDYSDGGYDLSYKITPSSGIEFVSKESVKEDIHIETDDSYPPDNFCGSFPQKYTFKAINSGSYKIEFVCQRSWESNPIEINIYKIKVA